MLSRQDEEALVLGRRILDGEQCGELARGDELIVWVRLGDEARGLTNVAASMGATRPGIVLRLVTALKTASVVDRAVMLGLPAQLRILHVALTDAVGGDGEGTLWKR